MKNAVPKFVLATALRRLQGIRTWIAFLAAIASIAFACGASAASSTGPTKQWSIAVLPTVIGTQNQKVTITIKNETPNGNSTINSLHIQLPAGYTLDTADNPGAPGSSNAAVQTSWLGTLSWGPTVNPNLISFTNISPLKPQGTFTMTAYVNAGASVAACSAGIWSGDAWTGSSFTGNTFNLIASSAYAGASNSTEVASTGSLAFSTPPSNVVSPNPVTGTVSATGCSTAVNGLSVLITVTDPTGKTITTTSTTTGSNGTGGFSVILPVGTYIVTASSSGFGSVSAPVTVFDGTLNCGENFLSTFTNPLNIAPGQPGYATGSRGMWNKDGSNCVLVPYTFTNTIPTNNTVHLSWDTTIQPNPTFEYRMDWKVRPVESTSPSSGWTLAPRPQVAWLTDSYASPIFVPGLACIGDSLPAPYGQVQGSVLAGDGQITVKNIPANPASSYVFPIPGAPAIPTDPSSTPGNLTFLPFPIVIADADVNGNATTAVERMQVTSATIVSQDATTGNYTMTFTVSRGQGGTSPAAHGDGFKVMSTPLPIIPSDATSFPATYTDSQGATVASPAGYSAGRQANMCVVTHGFISYGLDGSGNATVLYETTVFDIGDGWVRIGG